MALQCFTTLHYKWNKIILNISINRMLKQREKRRGRNSWDGERRTEVLYSSLGGVKVTLERRIKELRLLVTSSSRENSSALRCTIRMISPCFKINWGTVPMNFGMILTKCKPGTISKLDLLMGDLKSWRVWIYKFVCFPCFVLYSNNMIYNK